MPNVVCTALRGKAGSTRVSSVTSASARVSRSVTSPKLHVFEAGAGAEAEPPLDRRLDAPWTNVRVSPIS